MSDTPETDGLEAHKDDAVWRSVVPSKFARRLERERDAAREELASVRKELVSTNRGAEKNAKVNQGLCARLAEAERERDEARRDLVAAEELHRRRFGTLKAEYDAMNVELKQAIDRICQIRLERDNALATLELRVKVWSKEEEAK